MHSLLEIGHDVCYYMFIYLTMYLCFNVRPVFVQPVFVESFSSNPVRLRLDENRLDPNELDEK